MTKKEEQIDSLIEILIDYIHISYLTNGNLSEKYAEKLITKLVSIKSNKG